MTKLLLLFSLEYVFSIIIDHMEDVATWEELCAIRQRRRHLQDLSHHAVSNDLRRKISTPWFLKPSPEIKNGSNDSHNLEEADSLSSPTSLSCNVSNTLEKGTHIPAPGLYPIPPGSCPISADVLHFDFHSLSRLVSNFDVILMDPPWKILRSGFSPSANGVSGMKSIVGSSRSTAIKKQSTGNRLPYPQLTDKEIESLPLSKLQSHGLLFVWAVNSRIPKALDMMCRIWGYEFVTVIDWIKLHPGTGRLATGNGNILSHGKESLLIGKKSRERNSSTDEESGASTSVSVPVDYFFANRGLTSKKPLEAYDIIENIFWSSDLEPKNGHFLEIFGRPHNLRRGWVTIGNEL